MESAVAEGLRRKIIAEIGSGHLKPGDKLGSERALSERYGVSRSTLRHVLAALEEAGLVRRVVGRGGGTFVAHAKVERALDSVVGVPEFLSRQGYTAGTRILSTRIAVADEQTQAALDLGPGSLIADVRRIRLADGRPISLDHAQFPVDRFPGLLEMPLGGSLYGLLSEHYGTTPSAASETLEVVAATKDEGALLAVEAGSPLLSISRTTFDADGIPFECSYDLFRADRVRITMHSPGSGVRRESTADGARLEYSVGRSSRNEPTLPA